MLNFQCVGIKELHKAFSLIELIVVVTLIGILAAFAIPVYVKYKIRGQIGAAIPILYSFIDATKIAYVKGSADVPLTINNIAFTSTNGTGIGTTNMEPVRRVVYFSPGQAAATPVTLGTNEFMWCFYIAGLNGIPGYIEPVAANTTNAYSRLCAVVTENRGAFVVSCGVRDAGVGVTKDIPAEYLPAGCNCPNLNNRPC